MFDRIVSLSINWLIANLNQTQAFFVGGGGGGTVCNLAIQLSAICQHMQAPITM